MRKTERKKDQTRQEKKEVTKSDDFHEYAVSYITDYDQCNALNNGVPVTLEIYNPQNFTASF